MNRVISADCPNPYYVWTCNNQTSKHKPHLVEQDPQRFGCFVFWCNGDLGESIRQYLD